MKYYTETIPPTLAEKLKEKGMPMPANYSELCYSGNPTYAQVFDWLISRDINISIGHRETSVGLEWYPMVNGKCPHAIDGREWRHSANAAIEKVLTLI